MEEEKLLLIDQHILKESKIGQKMQLYIGLITEMPTISWKIES